jgi:hypothetical protein
MSQRKAHLIWLDVLFRGLVLISPLFILLVILDVARPAVGVEPSLRVVTAIVGLVILPFGLLVGALILWHVPGNAVGRLFVLFFFGGIGWSFAFMLQPQPVWTLPYWLIYTGTLVVGLPALMCIPLVFPDGKVYHRRTIGWILAFDLIIGIALILYWLSGTPLGSQAVLPWVDAIRIPALGPFHETFLTIAVNAMSPILLISVGSLWVRYRRSDLEQRLQIRWLAWGGGLFLLLFVVDGIAQSVSFLPVPVKYFDYPVYLSSILIPLSVGVAILRYRLWDIDLIIRRTLIYSVVSGSLAGVFFGGVAGLQTLFVRLTGERSPLAVVVSTLVIAALFNPLRRRVQAFVDRRFYRRKYDAELTLEAFAESLRDEVDIEHLEAALIGVIEETMQPETISLWLSGESGVKKY